MKRESAGSRRDLWASQIVVNSDPTSSLRKRNFRPPAKDSDYANRFEADSVQTIAWQSLHGTGGAKIVSSTTGAPDRISTSREISAQFDPS